MIELFANSGDPDQMQHSAVSDLSLHCLPVTPLGVSRLQWVNYNSGNINLHTIFTIAMQTDRLKPCLAE